MSLPPLFKKPFKAQTTAPRSYQNTLRRRASNRFSRNIVIIHLRYECTGIVPRHGYAANERHALNRTYQLRGAAHIILVGATYACGGQKIKTDFEGLPVSHLTPPYARGIDFYPFFLF